MVTPSRTLLAIPRGKKIEIRVTLDEFRGQTHVGIRTWWESGEAGWLPTRKGVALREEELPALRGALEEAAQALAALSKDTPPARWGRR